MPAWLLTPSAAAFQRQFVAQLVATGQWTGPQPSDDALAAAADLAAAGPAAFALAA